MIDAPSCLVEGNTVGTDRAGATAIPNGSAGILVCLRESGVTIGGTAIGAGNLVSGNSRYGIEVAGIGSLIEGNTVGTDRTGSRALGNSLSGIIIPSDGTSATIGGTAVGAGNLVSGNGQYGIDIAGQSILVEGNTIGTDKAGAKAIPNVNVGIDVESMATGSTIGGTVAGASNLISGNGDFGIDIVATTSLVEGNSIGTDRAGAVAIANGDSGIVLEVPATGATIGGAAVGAGNLLSGNTRYGLALSAPSSLVEGNTIGTDKAGATALPNLIGGIKVEPTGSGATIGGTSPLAGNLISGNGQIGIDIFGVSSLIQGNSIGTDRAGGKAVPNTLRGIDDEASGTGTTIGGSTAGTGNLISGNGRSGILISADSSLVEGNFVGTDVSGTRAVGNGSYGIYIEATAATIGGTSAHGGQSRLGQRRLRHRRDRLREPGRG